MLSRPSPRTTPDEWGAANRRYKTSAGVPGPRDPFLTPYMVPFGRAIAERKHRRVVMACSAQSGKSETLLDVMGQRLDQSPAPIVYVGPSKQFVSERFEPRVMDLLDEAPTLADKVQRGKRMSKTKKVIAGVPLILAHAGSSTALKSDPFALALTDEADELMGNVKGQGNPITLIDRRGDTYADFVHAIVSTPSEGPSEVEVDEVSGLEFWKEQDPTEVDSTIWKLWQQGTRNHWAWPCPHCREYFVPRFSCLAWPEKVEVVTEDGEVIQRKLTVAEVRELAYVECPRCEGRITDAQKPAMNAAGVYVAPGQHVTQDGIVVGDVAPNSTISFWVSGLASPFKTFGERAAEYVEAARSGDHEQVQTVTNGGFGELWAPAGGDVPEWTEVSRKRLDSVYQRGEVPTGVVALTLTADVQKNRIYWTIRGWGARSTSWLIDHGALHGPTIEEEIWTDLADLISTPVCGLPIRMAFVDSGFRPGRKDALPLNRVYEFCRRFPRNVRATKGSSAPMRTPLIVSKIEVNRKGKAAKHSIELVRLDTDHWKSWVHERVRWPADQVGAWHLPIDVEDDYCRQIVSEARIKRPSGRVQWVQRAKDNHYLDCEAMQAAVGHMLNAQRIAAAPRPAPERHVIPPAPRGDEALAPLVPARQHARSPSARPGGWLGSKSGWLR